MLYKRSKTRKWQARFRIGGYWKRITTKCNNLDEAKSNAIEQYMECMFKHKHGIPTVSKRFVDVAKLSVAKMNRLMEAGEGRRVYVDYISVIQNYLIPFFGKFNVANINHQQVSAYEQWRLERIGRVMRASTVSTHNSALNRVFDEAVERGYMSKSQIPILKNVGKASKRRADFSRHEYGLMLRALPAWTKKAYRPKSLQMRELLRDYIRFLASTGIRHGTEASNMKWMHLEVFEEQNRKYLAIWVNGKTGLREVIAKANTISYLKRIQQRCADIKHLEFEELLGQKLNLPVFRLNDGTVTKHLNQTFKKFLRDIDLLVDTKTEQQRTLYCLRHTYATFQLVNNNVDIHTLAKQMGTSIEMLEKHYSHLTPRLRKDVLTRRPHNRI